VRFIITGTPRAATRYAASLMRALDVPCTHERVFRPQAALIDALRWYREADSGESSWIAWAFLWALPARIPVFHTVRDPWKVIDSLAYRNQIVSRDHPKTDHQRCQRDAVETYCPRVAKQATAVDRAACLLIDWNRMIEHAADDCADVYVSYGVESMCAGDVAALLSGIGVERTRDEIECALDSVPRTSNQGREIVHDVPISHPGVEEYIKARFPGVRMSVQRISPTTTSKTPRELADMMSPKLVDEVNEYADRFGYDTVDAPQAVESV